MSLPNRKKINLLMQELEKGNVYLVKWLNAKGYSTQLLNKYKKSKWLESIGNGAVKRYGDNISYIGALHALQFQANIPIHIGATTALSLLGKSHYLEMNIQKIDIFIQTGKKLPKWFNNSQWEIILEKYHTSFLPENLGITTIDINNIEIKISSPARAILECLYLTPDKKDILECFEILESLNTLRPNIVQELLENCKSVKVKRLFLYLAEKTNHSWFNYLDLTKIDIGAGKREIVKNGVYNKAYKITVPKILENNENSNL